MSDKLHLDYHGLGVFKRRMQTYVDNGDSISKTFKVQLGDNESIGSYNTGDEIFINTPLEEVVKKILTKVVHPTYIAPTLKLTNVPSEIEIGTEKNIKPTATFTQNDAGDLEAITIYRYKNGQTEPSIVSQPSQNNPSVGDWTEVWTETYKFYATATYNDGPVKKNNLDELDNTGAIYGGEPLKSTEMTMKVSRASFAGIVGTEFNGLIDSDTIRNNAVSKCLSNISFPVLSVKDYENPKYIYVACPASSSKQLKKVIMPSAMNADCTADFVKMSNTILVEGADGYDSIPYNVWVYNPALITSDQTFSFTFG